MFERVEASVLVLEAQPGRGHDKSIAILSATHCKVGTLKDAVVRHIHSHVAGRDSEASFAFLRCCMRSHGIGSAMIPGKSKAQRLLTSRRAIADQHNATQATRCSALGLSVAAVELLHTLGKDLSADVQFESSDQQEVERRVIIRSDILIATVDWLSWSQVWLRVYSRVERVAPVVVSVSSAVALVADLYV